MSAASAQTVVDGDTLQLKGTTYRLYGIDAPDDGQVCPDGWPAAWEAESYLSQLIGGRTVTCTTIGLPKKDEAEAICRADGVDLGAATVTGYLTQEEAAA